MTNRNMMGQLYTIIVKTVPVSGETSGSPQVILRSVQWQVKVIWSVDLEWLGHLISKHLAMAWTFPDHELLCYVIFELGGHLFYPIRGSLGLITRFGGGWHDVMAGRSGSGGHRGYKGYRSCKTTDAHTSLLIGLIPGWVELLAAEEAGPGVCCLLDTLLERNSCLTLSIHKRDAFGCVHCRLRDKFVSFPTFIIPEVPLRLWTIFNGELMDCPGW